MKTIEQKSAIILIKSIRKELHELTRSYSNPVRIKYLSTLIRDLEEEFKVHSTQ